MKNVIRALLSRLAPLFFMKYIQNYCLNVVTWTTWRHYRGLDKNLLLLMHLLNESLKTFIFFRTIWIRIVEDWTLVIQQKQREWMNRTKRGMHLICRWMAEIRKVKILLKGFTHAKKYFCLFDISKVSIILIIIPKFHLLIITTSKVIAI